MNQAIPLTITENERAELEALLDDYLAEAKKDKDEHKRMMARVDENLARINRNLEAIRLNREQACGKSF
jgi:hypothetical protein